MRHFFLFLLAVAAHAHPGHSRIGERSTDSSDVNLSDLPALIEPWPGYFEGKGAHESLKARRLEKRSPSSVEVCRKQPGSPKDEGWLLKQSVCERQQASGLAFWSDCVGKADASFSASQLQGQCPGGHRCFEFHGMNELSEPAFDTLCVDYRSVREWFIDTTASRDYDVCSPKYINQIPGNYALNLSLQVNALDRARLNRIGPSRIYFWMDDRDQVGVERGDDPNVGSGIFTLYHGHWVRACVKVSPGQQIWAFAAIAAKTMLYCSAVGAC